MFHNKKQISEAIKSFDLKNLFIELGWDNYDKSLPVAIDEETFLLNAIVQKKGFVIFVCQPDKLGKIPTKDIRKKIDNKISKLHFEHLIIYVDKDKLKQVWQLVIRQSNKPLIVREYEYYSHQQPELLLQKLQGLFFEIEDEDKISIIDVAGKVQQQFNTNAERVTKRFYDEFKKHHSAFLKFIKGISEQVNKEWYASLMLNRLMFIYFIQKKGFLDNNPDYLRDKLKEVQKKKGKDKFYSFYRNFLLVLFHKGLGSPERNEELIKEIGKIPYLNGGLFDVHQLEKDNQNIEIPDEAFEKIFNFFDEYNWHLDTKMTASGKDINPDVIGYIFEKYINDRAEMGAYYTKEDITEYISKNTIIPFLFDRVREEVANAFKDDSSLWKMLKENPDRYIYDAVKYGVNLSEEEFNTDTNIDEPTHPLWKDLPDEIRAGFRPDIKDKIVAADERPHLWEIRKPWTKPAPSDIALPTEIYRELIERRKRYFEIRRKLVNGEIKEINDFITYNLNIRQFAQDAIQQYEGSDFINAFYKAITNITVLDPTCGSGAFLFAALNILEPLYYGCIQRMIGFTENDLSGKKFTNFRKILEEINKHPNEQYYIYKSIILNNLYGVDIMKEAVEIAKLRLFLKLVAEVEDFDHLEPLPDIDFNVRAGNTLIGYTNKKEIDELEGLFVTPKMKEKIFEECELVSKAFKRFKEIQVEGYNNNKEFTKAKKELNERLNKLKTELDKILHKQHYEGIEYNHWLETHKPFHWFAEFYEIINSGGFDVIIGNPPYVVIKKIAYILKVTDFKCSDLYGYIIRRCFQLLKKESMYGFIVMHNIAFSGNFSDVRKEIIKNSDRGWFSFFARIPSGLFSGDVRVRNCIFVIKRNNNQFKEFYSTRIHRWFSNAREVLFEKLNYSKFIFRDIIPMFSSDVLADFFENSKGKLLANFTQKQSRYKLYFKQNAYNWIAVSKYPAPCFDDKGKIIKQSKVSDISLNSEEAHLFSLLFLNGKVFFSKWLTYGDEFDVTKNDIFSVKVPIDSMNDTDKSTLLKLADIFSERIKDTVQYKLNAGKRVGTFNTSKLWYLTDVSDRIFLKYMCDNPGEVFEAIQDHIYQTVITTDEEENDEE